MPPPRDSSIRAAQKALGQRVSSRSAFRCPALDCNQDGSNHAFPSSTSLVAGAVFWDGSVVHARGGDPMQSSGTYSALIPHGCVKFAVVTLLCLTAFAPSLRALTETPSATRTDTARAPTVSTGSPTPTPTCAPTGTPYCTDHCLPCPTIRPFCFAAACGACFENQPCASGEVRQDCGALLPCLSCPCVTVTPGGVSPSPTLTPPAGTPTPCTTIAAPTISVSLSVDPQAPRVGDAVRLHFSVSGRGGLPSYTLRLGDQKLQGPTGPVSPSTFFGNVDFPLTATAAGMTTVTLVVNYETRYGCAEDPYFSFITQDSQPFTVNILPAAATTPTPTPTETPTCAPTGTPYCADRCVPCPTIRPFCFAAACGACFATQPCPPGEVRPACGASLPCLSCPCVTVTPGGACVGDCNDDGIVKVNEVVLGVNIALEKVGVTIDECRKLDVNQDGGIAIDELVQAVGRLLQGCGT